MPGLAASSARMSVPASVTARANLRRITSGSSRTSTMPCGEDDDLLIFADGSCRSLILATSGRMYGPGTVKVGPNRWLNRWREIPGELQVLPLVLAHRHLIGLVQQDVGGLQDRVGEQADAGLVLPSLADLSLNWIIRLGLAESGDAAEHPGQLGVLGHVGLHEHGAARGIEPAREQLGGGAPWSAAGAAPDPAAS